ncbi:unnamed protein product, partial [Angiostrongylus costaricensis]|uniref:Endo/exonuclease/phosphatase domain-containing protein n=1 Tax=Angiostrongylus costaricensis TaxID=334426 RepID=A0A0R3PWL8_ANGCS
PKEIVSYSARIVPEHSTDADLYALVEAENRIKFNVIALQETKKRSCHEMFGGVGFVIHQSIARLVASYEMYSPRIAVLRLQLMRHQKIVMFNCYSPSDAIVEYELELLYYQFSKFIRNNEGYYKFVAGGFNARIGKANDNEYKVRNFGLEERNRNGNRFAGLLYAALLFHGNSFFQKKESRRWV